MLGLLFAADTAAAQQAFPRFIASGAGDVFETPRRACLVWSNDGETWHNATRPTYTGNFAIGTGGGQAVAVPVFGPFDLLFTGDGEAWPSEVTTTDEEGYLEGTSVGHRRVGTDTADDTGTGRFVAVNNNALTTTTDVTYSDDGGASWEPVTVGPEARLTAIVGSPEQYVAVSRAGAGGSGSDNVFLSSDALTWTTVVSGFDLEWRAITWGATALGGEPTRYIAVSSSGLNGIMTSPEGQTWTQRSPPTDEPWNRIATNGTGRFVVAASGAVTNDVIFSDGGTSWTGAGSLGNGVVNGLTFGLGEFWALASNGSVYRSADGGETWTFQVDIDDQLNIDPACTWTDMKFAHLGALDPNDALPADFFGADTSSTSTTFGVSSTFAGGFIGIILAAALAFGVGGISGKAGAGMGLFAILGLGIAFSIGSLGLWVAMVVFAGVLLFILARFTNVLGGGASDG